MVEEILGSIDLRGVKGVLIDLDNTLYPYETNHKRSMEKCVNRCEQHYGISRDNFMTLFRSSREDVHKQLFGQAASHSRLLYFQKFAESNYQYTDPLFALEMEELYWSEFLAGITFYQGVETFLQRIKTAGISSCIVTDLTSQIQFRKWQQLNLGRYIQYMVSSEEAGIEKPDPAIFNLALKKLSLNASEVIMIGDHPEKDIKGAESIGIKSYLVREE
jgi:HAD superfamily hydrolase (TIGR01549 family)